MSELRATSQLGVQPGASVGPEATDGAGRGLQSLRGFVDGQPGKIAQLDDLGHLRVDRFQARKSFIER